jgi:hypothetical protein
VICGAEANINYAGEFLCGEHASRRPSYFPGGDPPHEPRGRRNDAAPIAPSLAEIAGDIEARRREIQVRALEVQWEARYATLDEASLRIVNAELERLVRVHGSRGLTKWMAAETARDPSSPLHRYIWPDALAIDTAPEGLPEAPQVNSPRKNKGGRPRDDRDARIKIVEEKLRSLRSAGAHGILSVREVAAASPAPIDERTLEGWAQEDARVKDVLHERLTDPEGKAG